MTDEVPPIFIVGMPRSGTTLVGMLLNGHSQVCIAPETHYFDKFQRKGERHHCLDSESAFSEFVRFFLGSYEFKSFGFSPDECESLYCRIVHAGIRSHRHILGTTLSHYTNAKEKCLCGEKTPKHMNHIGAILETFPEARIVFVFRDPRDVVLSLRCVRWERGNMVEHLRQWAKSVRTSHVYSQLFPSQIFVLKYEDLLSYPEKSLRQVCDFLHVPFEVGMLAHDPQPRANFDINLEPWKRKNLDPLDTQNQMKWKSQMEAWECAIVEARVGAEMADLGYPSSGWGFSGTAKARLAFLHAENVTLLMRHCAKSAWLRATSSY